MTRIDVELPGGSGYPIWIGCDNLPGLGSALAECEARGDAFVMSDRTVWGLHGTRLKDALEGGGYRALEAFLIDPGEESKSLDQWRAVLDRLVDLEDGAVRSMFLLNFGGGVVGDLGGFAAACYRRGIPFAQAPTTLLAQVDSSVGGKTAVNHPGGKNLIGAFHQPFCVFIDTGLLKTLRPKEFRAGLAEVLKYGLICDEGFFGYLEQRKTDILALDESCLMHIVTRSCRIKADIVGRDERERQGLRTLLNLGHTFGHALEAATQYRVFLHGEAVGIGILCAARMSVALGMLRSEEYDRIGAVLEAVGLATHVRGVRAERVWEAMRHDKKFISGHNRFVLLEAIGKACVVEDIDPSLVSRALEAHLE